MVELNKDLRPCRLWREVLPHEQRDVLLLSAKWWLWLAEDLGVRW